MASSPQETRRNPYQGVNAHIQSFAQHNSIGAWKMWHNAYINDIFNTLSVQLPDGYEVGMTTSLQISEYHPDSGERTTETLHIDNDLYLTGLMIYRVIEESDLVAVTRIEILSPTNKPPGDGFIQYFEKRDATLTQEMPLIEIDLLHESRPVPRGVPSYPDRHPEAHAYSIYVNDTHSGLQDGTTRVYGFGVHEPFPIVPIPLAGKEHILFDFGEPYNTTYSRLKLLRHRIDFQQVPLAFETYSIADQERIQSVMKSIGTNQ